MSTQYMLDTNICIYIAKNKPVKVLEHFKSLEVNQVVMSVITYGELKVGAEKSQQKKSTLEKLARLVEIIPVIPLSNRVGDVYGNVRARLEKSGNIIGNNDLWIASHALEQKLTLVSNNIKEFKRIEELELENWI